MTNNVAMITFVRHGLPCGLMRHERGGLLPLLKAENWPPYENGSRAVFYEDRVWGYSNG